MTESSDASVPEGGTSTDAADDRAETEETERAETEEPEETVRPGPLWRHALWVAGVTLVGVGLGRVDSLYRLGPDHYGIPLSVPGQVGSYVAVWTVTGLAVAALMRAVAARIPVYGLEIVTFLLLFTGTRLSLGHRPEPPVLAAGVAAALTAAVVWCAVCFHQSRRTERAGRAS